jgi:hypothetical protein
VDVQAVKALSRLEAALADARYLELLERLD